MNTLRTEVEQAIKSGKTILITVNNETRFLRKGEYEIIAGKSSEFLKINGAEMINFNNIESIKVTDG